MLFKKIQSTIKKIGLTMKIKTLHPRKVTEDNYASQKNLSEAKKKYEENSKMVKNLVGTKLRQFYQKIHKNSNRGNRNC